MNKIRLNDKTETEMKREKQQREWTLNDEFDELEDILMEAESRLSVSGDAVDSLYDPKHGGSEFFSLVIFNVLSAERMVSKVNERLRNLREQLI